MRFFYRPSTCSPTETLRSLGAYDKRGKQMALSLTCD
jgi:hypothetical protein